MKNLLPFNIFIISLLFVFSSCSKINEIEITPPPNPNLLSNSSFEFNGTPSLQGWSIISRDSSYISFSSETPPNGGKYSVKLGSEWVLGGTIKINASVPLGTHRYQLSTWTKSFESNPFSFGTMIIQFQRFDSVISRKYTSFSDSTWTLSSIMDTLTVCEGDSVFVILEADHHQFSSGYICFDLCKFEKLD